MFDFDAFDTDMDGDADGLGFIGFDYLMRLVFGRHTYAAGNEDFATDKDNRDVAVPDGLHGDITR